MLIESLLIINLSPAIVSQGLLGVIVDGDCRAVSLRVSVNVIERLTNFVRDYFCLFAVSANYLTKIGLIDYQGPECPYSGNLSTTIEEHDEMPAIGAYNHAYTTSWNVLVGCQPYYIIYWCKYCNRIKNSILNRD